MKKPTRVICPFSEALIVLSILVLKFHLSIDINEVLPSGLKSGKDLKDTNNYFCIHRSERQYNSSLNSVFLFVDDCETRLVLSLSRTSK